MRSCEDKRAVFGLNLIVCVQFKYLHLLDVNGMIKKKGQEGVSPSIQPLLSFGLG